MPHNKALNLQATPAGTPLARRPLAFRYASMKPLRTIALTASLFLSGCVAPIPHTYFVPNPSDGKPVRSSSCGYLKNNENSLQRQFGDLKITVSPDYPSDKRLYVNFFLTYPSKDITFNPEKVEVRETTKDLVLHLVDTRVSSYGPDRTHPYTLSVTLYFSLTAADIDSLRVALGKDALYVGGQEISLEPFRFKQNTSTDLYYASINC